MPRTNQKEQVNIVVSRSKGVRAVLDRRLLGEKSARALATAVDHIMLGGTPLKDGRTSTVGQVQLEGRELVIKRSNWKGWRRGMRYGIFGSRAKRSWLAGQRLRAAGFPTPEVLGYVEERHWGLLKQAWSFQAFVKGPHLLDWLTSPGRTKEQRQMMAYKVFKLMYNLHAAGITFGDMKQSNLLVVNNGLVLIDLDGVRIHWTPLVRHLRQHRDTETLQRSWRDHPELADIFREAATGERDGPTAVQPFPQANWFNHPGPTG